MLEGKTFLVTGATGRLGCALVPRIESLGGLVLPVVLPGYAPTPKRVPWTAEAQPILVNEPADLAKLSAPTHVVNLHWRVDRTRGFADQLAGEIQANIADLAFVWDWIVEVGVESFLNVSSFKVYGKRNAGGIRSDVEPLPDTPYGIAKLASERFFDARLAGSGCRVVHLRPTSIASIGEHPSQLVSRICTSAVHGERIKVFTGTKTYLLHLNHAVDLMIQAAIAPGRSCYLVAGEGARNEEIVALFERRLGRKVVADYVNQSPDTGTPRVVSDTSKLFAPWVRSFSLVELVDDFCRTILETEPV
jgi:nucleoside-diphosphate-sugar epimerase